MQMQTQFLCTIFEHFYENKLKILENISAFLPTEYFLRKNKHIMIETNSFFTTLGI